MHMTHSVLHHLWYIFPSCKFQFEFIANDGKEQARLNLLHISSLDTTLSISTYTCIKLKKIKKNMSWWSKHSSSFPQELIQMIFEWADFNLPPVKVPDGSKVSPARVTVLVLTLGSKVTYNTEWLDSLMIYSHRSHQ